MNNQNDIKPYIATAGCNDINGLRELLDKLETNLQREKITFWSALESPFELKLAGNEIVIPAHGKLNRGHIFWSEAEIKFRYDGSRPENPYRLVLVADGPLFPEIFNDAGQTLKPYGWEPKVQFSRLLWGKPLITESNQSWYTTRIPGHLGYPGLVPRDGEMPYLTGIEYRRLGRVEFYRFTGLISF